MTVLASNVADWWKVRAPEPDLRRIVLAAVLYNLGLAAYLFLFSLFLMDHGYTERMLGLATTAMVLGTMAGTLPIGWLASRFSLRRVVLVCLLLVGPIFLARTAFFNLPLQLLLAFTSGMVLCGWVTGLSPLLAGVTDDAKRPFAFSLLFSAATLACGAGNLLGSHLPGWTAHSLHISGQLTTLVVGSLLAMTAAWPVARLTHHRAPAPSDRRTPPPTYLFPFFAACAIYAASVGCFIPFISIFFNRRLGFALAPLGNLLSKLQLIEALAVLMLPLLLRRVSLPVGILTTQLTAACSLALLAGSHGGAQAALGLGGYLAALHMGEPLFQSMLMNSTTPEERSAASATYFLVTSLAQAGAATLGGAVIARYGYSILCTGAVTAMIVAATFLRMVLRSSKQQAQNVPAPHPEIAPVLT